MFHCIYCVSLLFQGSAHVCVMYLHLNLYLYIDRYIKQVEKDKFRPPFSTSAVVVLDISVRRD